MKYLVQTLAGPLKYEADIVTITAEGDLVLYAEGQTLAVFHLPQWSGVQLAPEPTGHDRIYGDRPAVELAKDIPNG